MTRKVIRWIQQNIKSWWESWFTYQYTAQYCICYKFNKSVYALTLRKTSCGNLSDSQILEKYTRQGFTLSENYIANNSEAEYRAMTNGVCEMLWLKRLPVNMPMKLYCNNKAIISIGQNPMQHDHTNHVEIATHFIKKKIDIGALCMLFVTTTQ